MIAKLPLTLYWTLREKFSWKTGSAQYKCPQGKEVLVQAHLMNVNSILSSPSDLAYIILNFLTAGDANATKFFT